METKRSEPFERDVLPARVAAVAVRGPEFPNGQVVIVQAALSGPTAWIAADRAIADRDSTRGKGLWGLCLMADLPT